MKKIKTILFLTIFYIIPIYISKQIFFMNISLFDTLLYIGTLITIDANTQFYVISKYKKDRTTILPEIKIANVKKENNIKLENNIGIINNDKPKVLKKVLK